MAGPAPTPRSRGTVVGRVRPNPPRSSTGARGWRPRSRRSTSRPGRCRRPSAPSSRRVVRHATPTSSPPATRRGASDGRLVAVAIALVAALVGGAIAVVQRQDAQSAQGVAEAATSHARASRRWSGAPSRCGRRSATRPRCSTIEAFRLSDTPRTRSALLSHVHRRAAVLRHPPCSRVRPAARASSCPTACRRTPSISTAGCARTGWTTDRSATPCRRSATASDRSAVLVASPDGRLLAQASRVDLDDGPTAVGIFDTATGTLAVRADRRRRHGVVGRVHRRRRSTRAGDRRGSSPARHRQRVGGGGRIEPGSHRASRWTTRVAPEPAAAAPAGPLWRPPAVAIERPRRRRRLGRRFAADVRRRHVRAESHHRGPTRDGVRDLAARRRDAPHRRPTRDRARRSHHRGGRLAARPERLVDR